MSCHQCAKKLPFTAQKIACPICKFIMCKKCLNYNLDKDTPGSSRQKSMKVCFQCYESAINKEPDADPRASNPPVNFLRRLEELQKKSTTRLNSPTHRSASVGSVEKLAERLDSLTAEESVTLPTEDQLRARLDALSGFINARDVRPKSNKQSDTEEDQVKRVLDQASDEARIDKRYGLLGAKVAKDPDEARIYCSLCDNVAVVICPACMDEEFCNHCFQRAHKHKHMRHHESTPIERTKMS